jgi:hypothetical protein
MIGALFKTLLFGGGAGWAINKATNGAVMDNVVSPVFNSAKNTVKETTQDLVKDFDIGQMAEDHWGKAGIGAALLGAFKGEGMIRNLSIGVLLATAAYFAYKHFSGPKSEFNTQAAEGAPESTPQANFSALEPEPT